MKEWLEYAYEIDHDIWREIIHTVTRGAMGVRITGTNVTANDVSIDGNAGTIAAVSLVPLPNNYIINDIAISHTAGSTNVATCIFINYGVE